jgi:hypothetical protein
MKELWPGRFLPAVGMTIQWGWYKGRDSGGGAATVSSSLSLRYKGHSDRREESHMKCEQALMMKANIGILPSTIPTGPILSILHLFYDT